jgi:hypothetical protein
MEMDSSCTTTTEEALPTGTMIPHSATKEAKMALPAAPHQEEGMEKLPEALSDAAARNNNMEVEPSDSAAPQEVLGEEAMEKLPEALTHREARNNQMEMETSENLAAPQEVLGEEEPMEKLPQVVTDTAAITTTTMKELDTVPLPQDAIMEVVQ